MILTGILKYNFARIFNWLPIKGKMLIRAGIKVA